MENLVALIAILTAGGLIVLAPLFIMLIYKAWKENKDEHPTTQTQTQPVVFIPRKESINIC